MSAIRTWLRAQREARNREAFARLVAEHPPIPEFGPDIGPEGRNFDGRPYELDPWHPLSPAVMTVREAGEHLRRYMAETGVDMVALSGLPGGGRWLPPRS